MKGNLVFISILSIMVAGFLLKGFELLWGDVLIPPWLAINNAIMIAVIITIFLVTVFLGGLVLTENLRPLLIIGFLLLWCEGILNSTVMLANGGYMPLKDISDIGGVYLPGKHLLILGDYYTGWHMSLGDIIGFVGLLFIFADFVVCLFTSKIDKGSTAEVVAKGITT